MEKKKKKLIIVLGVVASLILLGIICFNVINNKGKVTYTYNNSNIIHYEKLYIAKTEYYKNKVKIYFKGNEHLYPENLSTQDDANAIFVKTGNTITIYSDNPSDITSLEVSDGEYFEILFRYLNTNEYATMWRFWGTDIGWMSYYGDSSKYYTEEEKSKQRKETEKRQEQREQEQAVTEEIFQIVEGKWICSDGDYFDVYKNDRDVICMNVNVHMNANDYDNEDWQAIDFRWVDKDNKTAYLFHDPYDFFDLGCGYEIVLSENNDSFECNGKEYKLADRNIWSGVDAKYVYAIKVLLENSDEWKFLDGNDVTNSENNDEANPNNNDVKEVADETEVSVETEVSEDTNEKVYGCKYAITDLDGNGNPELIKSGYTGDEEYGYSVIYEVSEDNTIKEINSNVLKNREFTELPPNLYNIESCLYFNGNYSYENFDGYKYVVEGSRKIGEDGYYKTFYKMSIQYDSIVLEKICSMEDNETDIKYYDENGNEITTNDYRSIWDLVRKNAMEEEASFGWFEETTEENMANSLKVFLE